ncbi:MAG: hypothetical protein ACI9BW_002559 [Gammaproteobacteria bacterium]|jgi:hypothetical protein
MWKMISVVLIFIAAVVAYLYFLDRPRLDTYLNGTPLELPVAATEVYKWRDSKGQWNITSTKPPTNISFETMRYRSDENILPPAPPKEQ